MDLKIIINSHCIEAVNKKTSDLNYHRASFAMLTLSQYLNAKKNIELDEFGKSCLSSFNKANEDILASCKTYEEFLLEHTFIANYSAFEEFIAKSLQTLYDAYPTYLQMDEFQVRYEDLFEQNSIEHLKTKVIDKKVKNIIQSSNVYSLVNKLTSVFGIRHTIGREALDRLFTISQQRNILIHNNGIVNTYYVEELRKNQIPVNLEIGDYVLKQFRHLPAEIIIKNMWDFIYDIINKIREGILNDELRLAEHHIKTH